jgi:hypothetical protein
MLRIRIDGQDVETTPTSLAKLVFDGTVDQRSATRLPGGTAEQPLELSLGSPHWEALTVELHRRLQMMCSMDAGAVDVQELCARVEDLCRWRWGNSPVAARFFWAAAWLNELVDRTKNAVELYDAFLLMPCSESHLRLLALNNRGVLRIQLGRLDGVQDLARAAIPEGPPNAMPRAWEPQPDGLPAACFNLLNLINASFGAADLLCAVDEELADYFSRLPEDLRTLWLGQSSEPDDSDSREEPFDPLSAGVCRDLRILRDPTYQRLNSLATRLSVQARKLVPDSRGPLGHASSAFRQLSLWDCRLDGDRPAPEETIHHGDRGVPDRHERYAEAAGLLLSDDIPSTLTGPEDPLARVEQSAREELAVIEGHVALGRYELARSRLHVQRKILLSLNARGGLAAVLARVDEQLERVTALEAQGEQLKLQQACTKLVAEVQEFCTLTDAHQAQSRLADLQCRLLQFRPQAGAAAAGLLDELGTRLQHHMDGLRQAQIEMLLAEPLQHVRQHQPSDEAVPVPDSVYQALARCRLCDPQERVESWAAWEEQLNAHQARYHVRRALSALQSGPGVWDQVQDDLAEALRYDPSSWLTVSSLFGWGTTEDRGQRTEDRGQKTEGGAVVRPPSSALRLPGDPPPFTTGQAGLLLGTVLRRLGGDAQRCTRLWRYAETTLSPALAGADAEALAGARLLAEKCLDSWPPASPETPGRADPRHPVNRFLEACEKARRLVEAEQLLDARPPRLEEAQRHLAGILQSGVDTRDQLRRIVTGFYLAQCREKDSPSVQRQVLADLEAWVKAVPPEAVLQMRGRDIVEETEKVRVAVAERSASGLCPARPDESATDEMRRELSAESWGGRHPRPTQNKHTSARKEA